MNLPVILMCLPAIFVNGEAVARTSYAMAWKIAPITTLPSPGTALPGDVILKQPLVPLGYAELEENMSDATGNILIRAGDKLFLLPSTDGKIYCSFEQKYSFARSLITLTGRQFLCLTDMNGDNKFEGSFAPDSLTSAIPIINGSFDKIKSSLPHIGFKEANADDIESSDIGSSLWVGIIYQGRNIYKQRNFTIAFGQKFGKESLSNFVSINESDLPASKDILGAKLIVTDVPDKKKLNYRIEAGFPEQPFSLTASIVSY